MFARCKALRLRASAESEAPRMNPTEDARGVDSGLDGIVFDKEIEITRPEGEPFMSCDDSP